MLTHKEKEYIEIYLDWMLPRWSRKPSQEDIDIYFKEKEELEKMLLI